MNPSLKTLIGKLNGTCRDAMARAASIAVARGHYEVDVEHIVAALSEQNDTDFQKISGAAHVRLQELRIEIDRHLNQLKTGSQHTPVFSPYVIRMLEQAWLIASLDSGDLQIRTSHLLLATLSETSLRQIATRISGQFDFYSVDKLKHGVSELVHGSVEERSNGQCFTTGQEGSAPRLDTDSRNPDRPALEQYTVNLTQLAQQGAIDPVIGREKEIRQVIDILLRRRQNNPILTGEPGVGKTAVVEGLALRIARKEVPASLAHVELRSLDMGLLLAGASVKGEFENRLKSIIAEIKKSPLPVILFIDEAHTIIGAGGQAGQNDAANLLKPVLARGEFRTIGATTWSEYKRYFEKDAAFARRFQTVKVEEPSEDIACAMLRGLIPLMEKHFNVRILDEAIKEAVKLSHRYMVGRQLPDKAISVLDTACAKVALGQESLPGAIEDGRMEVDRIQHEIDCLSRESLGGGKHDERLTELEAMRNGAMEKIEVMTSNWSREKALIERLRPQNGSRGSDRGGLPDLSLSTKGFAAVEQANQIRTELKALQADCPFIPLHVDKTVVAGIVSQWTGIPLGNMVKDEIKSVIDIERLLKERVIGQDHALKVVAQSIKTSRANLDDPNKPKGVFLFVGPSGVGKTETALALAELLYGGERKLIAINMSEYQESHSISGLKGSPPGYVGYGEGGVLTEAVRISPYSVVLLDEIEKAHPDVVELFYQVLDKGVMEDGEGRLIDFKNTTVILTSNVASAQIMKSCLNVAVEQRPTMEDLDLLIRPVLSKTFKPAFLGRLKVVPYYPVPDNILASIVRLKLKKVGERIHDHHKARFDYDDAVVDSVVQRCTEVNSGARAVDNVINGSILPGIADLVLDSMIDGKAINSVKVAINKAGTYKFVIR